MTNNSTPSAPQTFWSSASLPIKAVVVMLPTLAGLALVTVIGLWAWPAGHGANDVKMAKPSVASQSQDTPSETTPLAVQTPTAPSMDMAELAAGNYTSVAGQWVNEAGHVMTFTPTSFTFVHEGSESFSVEGLEIPYAGGEFRFAPAIVTNHPTGVVQLQWVDQAHGFPYENGVLFFPPNTEIEYWSRTATTDTTRERIVAVGAGYASGRDLPEILTPFIFYRVPPGQTPAQVSQALAAKAQTAKEAELAACRPPVPGAYRCAGGPIPADAIALSAPPSPQGGAAIRTPSGNIRCGLYDRWDDQLYGYGYLACHVQSWVDERRFIPESNGGPDGGIPHVTLDSGEARYRQLGTAPHAFLSTGESDITTEVSYGKVYKYAQFACASADNGLTCWNEDTGHGVFINREQFLPF